MARASVNLAKFKPNLLINGLFDHWQRGTSTGAGTTPAYASADRWMTELSGAGSIAFARSTLVPNSNITYSMQITKTSAASGARLNQRIEADNIIPYIGKTMCMSFWVRLESGSISAGSIIVRSPLAKDTWTADNTTENTVYNDTISASELAATGNWIRLYRSFTVDSSCVNGISCQIQFNVSTDFVLQVAGCMLTEGSYPPAQTYRYAQSVGDELTACQRYYRVVGSTTNWMFPIFGRGFSTNEIRWNINNMTTGMRGTLAVDITDGTLDIRSATGATVTGSPTTYTDASNAGRFSMTGLTGVTSGALYVMVGSGNFKISSEL